MSILVTGDIIQDIYLYQGDRLFPSAAGKVAPVLTCKAGGAASLYELLDAALTGHVKLGLKIPNDLAALQPVHTLWHSCEGGTKEEHLNAAKDAPPPKVWRVAKSLGYGMDQNLPGILPRTIAAAKRKSVIVIDDAGLTFRSLRANASWPIGISKDDTDHQPDWIIHKMTNPMVQGDLWRELVCGPGRRANLITIVSADELRRAGAAISRGFSWERTLSELCAELNHNPLFQPLLNHPRHLIVNFGCVGAIWFGDPVNVKKAKVQAQDRATLVYDPSLPEGAWKTLLADPSPVYGHLNTFTAAIALAAAEGGSAAPDLKSAVQRGLYACRQLRLLGHGPVGVKSPGMPLSELTRLLRRPHDGMTIEELRSIKLIQNKLALHEFQVISAPPGLLTKEKARTWTLAAMAENPPTPPKHAHLPLYGLAHRVALYGETSVVCIPHARFGKLLSIDRNEIETLRSLSLMMTAYEKSVRPKQPLCLAAFGPPGAGKSFGIKEIAFQQFGKDVAILEFNLSQYNEPSDLIGAFHQVRDQCLKGTTPVVFWDEFDSRSYEWLQYLLAPMQDGTFQEDGHTHTLGKCIFVFAGGTSWDFEHFGPAPMPEAWSPSFVKSMTPVGFEIPRDISKAHPAIHHLAAYYLANPNCISADAAANEEFRRKKGPDFLSRLDGYINVLGPNPRLNYNWSERQWNNPDPTDITFPVRRALLLRQFLDAKNPIEYLNIDRDLLRAFLLVPRYRHGSRSLEKIAKPLALATGGRPPFRRAHLPPPQVLAQHLETELLFDGIYEQNSDFETDENLLKMAAAIADYYDSVYTQSYKARTAAQALRAFKIKARSTNSWDQWTVATNVAAAQRLPLVLSLVGLRLERGHASKDELEFAVNHLKKHLTILAKEEHDLWRKFHEDNDWLQASKAKLEQLNAMRLQDQQQDTRKYKAEIKRLKEVERIHTLLVPFEKLPDGEEKKDHDAIQNYPSIVSLIGWKIVFQ